MMNRSKTRSFLTAAIILFSLLTLLIPDSHVKAQTKITGENIHQQLKKENIEIPFVDRDGDGINDLLQNGWGLRFLRQYKNRRAVWNQMMNDEQSGKLVDTDGDGVPDTQVRELAREQMNILIDTDNDGTGDTPFRQYMKNMMKGLVDSNGDGVPDTPLGEYMRKQFQMLDQNGDGIPDELTPEQISLHIKEMHEWMKQIRDNIMSGESPFIDENGDGIPDNLPAGLLGWLHRHKKGKGIGGF